MSKNRNRAKLNKAETNKEYKNIIIDELYPPYWDEGASFYPKYNKGTNHPIPKLYSSQIRMYKTWKHNRKTQWKYKK
jgi:hypothetical protein